MKQAFIVFLLLASFPSFAQLDLTGSKIIGVGVSGGFGGIQGFRGTTNLQYGKFISDKFYLGSHVSFGRFSNSGGYKRLQMIDDILSSDFEQFKYVETSIATGIETRYLLSKSNFKPYLAAGVGLRYTNFNASPSKFTTVKENQLFPSVNAGAGFMAFVGKKKNFSFDFDLRYELATRIKAKDSEATLPNRQFRPQIGFSYRF